MEQPGRSEEQARTAVVVLFDTTTGEIVHGHCHEAGEGAELPSPEELEKEAMEHVQRHARRGAAFDAKKSAFLHLNLSDFRTDRLYKVDIQTHKLVEATSGGSLA